MAAMMWAVSKSPAMLILAGLSPLIAVAGLLDARRRIRRSAGEDTARQAEQERDFRRLVGGAQRKERSARSASSRSAAECCDQSVRFFGALAAGDVTLRLGTGTRPSTVGIGGRPARPTPHERELTDFAARLSDCPVELRMPAVLAVVGPLPLARSVARGFVLQLAATLAPARGRFSGLSGDGTAWRWLESLPHAGDGVAVQIIEALHSPGFTVLDDGPGTTGARHMIVIAESLDDVPSGCQVFVRLDHGSRAVVSVGSQGSPAEGDLSPEFVSEGQAVTLAAVLAARVRNSGSPRAEIPESVSLLDLLESFPRPWPEGSSQSGLPVPLGSDSRAQVVLDLVSQGPHAVIGGTTGSGKSELLLSWVTGLVCLYGADEVTVLLVDFKGGAAFDSFTHLEQCVGLITDLDPRQAERALGSLRAEIRYREQLLRDDGARDIAAYHGGEVLPRLVIVVDEFAVMLAEFPALHDLFVDIGARGRSLGMHLILCTQRPVGVIRDTLLSNCDLRLSLRVNNPGDSTALIGIPAAAALPAGKRGRCYVSVGGQAARLFQIARSTPESLRGARRLNITVRRPWLAPLPALLDLDELRRSAVISADSAGGVVFGRFDLPGEQAQPVAVWLPQAHGPLLVLGAGRSGRTSVLAAMASGLSHIVWIPADRAGAWDRLGRVVEDLAGFAVPTGETGAIPQVVVIDDLDSLLASFEQEYQGEVVRWLALMLRDGSRRGVVLLAAAQRVASPLSALAPLFAGRILLRHSSRQEFLLAEGQPADFDEGLTPGEGTWSGRRLKVAQSSCSTSAVGQDVPACTSMPWHSPIVPPRPSRSRRLLVVSRSPNDYLAERAGKGGQVIDLAELVRESPRPSATDYLDSHGDGDGDGAAGDTPWDSLTIVGEPEAWLGQWALFAALRSQFDVLFDGCGVAEYRAVSRRRDLPPPVNPGRPRRWLLTPAGTLSRQEDGQADGQREPRQ